jgi:hypothetical protein
MALDLIWDMLLEIFKSTQHFSQLKSMRGRSIGNDLYQLKVPDPFHWGPFAMLVKEVAFHAHSVGNHDYLELAEIIETFAMSTLRFMEFPSILMLKAHWFHAS